MRSQAERERQSLEIATAVLGAALGWAILVGVAAAVTAALGGLDDSFQAIVPLVIAGYLLTVAAWLLVARRRGAGSDVSGRAPTA